MDELQSFLAAIRSGETDEVLARLAAGFDPNRKTPHDFTPLMCAAQYGAFEIAAALLAAGADVNFQGDRELPALCYAAGNGSAAGLAIMRLLLEAGADLDGRGRATPLMWASRDSYAAMEWLLDRGADPNFRRPPWEPALHFCIGADYWLGAKLLLERGADPSHRANAPPDSGIMTETCLEHAVRLNRRAIVPLLQGNPLPSLTRDQVLERLERVRGDAECALRQGAAPTAVTAFEREAGV